VVGEIIIAIIVAAFIGFLIYCGDHLNDE